MLMTFHQHPKFVTNIDVTNMRAISRSQNFDSQLDLIERFSSEEMELLHLSVNVLVNE